MYHIRIIGASIWLPFYILQSQAFFLALPSLTAKFHAGPTKKINVGRVPPMVVGIHLFRGEIKNFIFFGVFSNIPIHLLH